MDQMVTFVEITAYVYGRFNKRIDMTTTKSRKNDEKKLSPYERLIHIEAFVCLLVNIHFKHPKMHTILLLTLISNKNMTKKLE